MRQAGLSVRLTHQRHAGSSESGWLIRIRPAVQRQAGSSASHRLIRILLAQFNWSHKFDPMAHAGRGQPHSCARPRCPSPRDSFRTKPEKHREEQGQDKA